ncbi:hypothetical protein CDAR_608321 [Caerostris darwini]|uniref:Uncharacterized protein n=1 Tax=Caerostris darwini TaxID=1538125 RepID=A0AAV4UGG8_9ARAC|nr:hypothetical protein CDAR_608321 [Caerostris darwini]
MKVNDDLHDNVPVTTCFISKRLVTDLLISYHKILVENIHHSNALYKTSPHLYSIIIPNIQPSMLSDLAGHSEDYVWMHHRLWNVGLCKSLRIEVGV